MRIDRRKRNELRPVEIIRGFTHNAPGSVLIKTGNTTILCTACWEEGIPPWRKGSGLGWLTAEYDMLPGSTPSRRDRNRGKIDGRTQEIQRLIGRSLRAVTDFETLGENTIRVDCDVLQADGGTRTASITGAYVAVCDLIKAARRERWIKQDPLKEGIAAISIGKVGGKLLLDLNYHEDQAAEVDMNVVMMESGRFIEVQGTGESGTFSHNELNKMLHIAARGIRRLLDIQAKSLRKRLKQ